MATRLSAGGIGSHDMVPLNIAAGAEPPSRGQATNLSGSHRPSTVLSHVEYFADEIVLNELEKRQIMGVPITRRISLAMLGCCCLATIVVAVMLTKAFSHGSSGSGGYEDQDQQPMELSAAEGKERYELFQSLLEPLVGGSVSVSGTPEASALYWMAYDDPARLNPRAKVDKVIQRFVLATLYYATNGEKWGKSYSFLSYNDECNWNHGSDSEIGAYCKADKRFVDTLILHNNNLNGTLPRDIGLLTHLSRVDMSGNDIRGHLPSTIGLLSKLTYLDFSK